MKHKCTLLMCLVATVIAVPVWSLSDSPQATSEARWAKITTVGGATHEGQLLWIRFSAFYGSNAQCPGMIWDSNRPGLQEFILNVGAERRTFDSRNVKSVTLEWMETDVGGCLEPSFRILDMQGGQSSAKVSWLPSTSTSDAALLGKDGEIIRVPADPCSKSQQQDLIRLLEFTDKPMDYVDPETLKQKLSKQVADLQGQLEQRQKMLDEAQASLAQARQSLAGLDEEIAKLKSDKLILETELQGRVDYIRKQADYIMKLQDKLRASSGPAKSSSK